MKDLEQPPSSSSSYRPNYDNSIKNDSIIKNNKPKKKFSFALNRYALFNIILSLALFISIVFSIYSYFYFKTQLKKLKITLYLQLKILKMK